MLILFYLPNFKNRLDKIYPFLSMFLHGIDLQLSILSKLTSLKKPIVVSKNWHFQTWNNFVRASNQKIDALKEGTLDQLQSVFD